MTKRTITICDNCGNQLEEWNYSKKGKDFCSDECRDEFFLNEEENEMRLREYMNFPTTKKETETRQDGVKEK